MKSKLWLALPLVLLSGCATDDGGLNLSNLPVDGEDLTQITGTIKDASVQKEALYFKARADRDRQYQKMYDKSGMKLTFEMVEVKPDVFIQVLKSAAHRSDPRFAQVMPNGPSIHPVWGAVNKGLEITKDVALGWFLFDGVKSAIDTPSYQYNGPYNSYNPVTSTSTSTTSVQP